MKYKVGDRVLIKSIDWYNENKTIHGDIWFDNAVFVGGQSLYCGCELTIRLVTYDSYYVIENDYYWTDEMIEGLVEKETKSKYEDEVTEEYYSTPKYLVRPNGYQFVDENGNVINARKIVLEKKKPKYPTTYEECCEVLSLGEDGRLYTKGYKASLIQNFQKLLICRDAYWKIAGEEMGLGKPWEPDWTNLECDKFCIWVDVGDITLRDVFRCQHILAFPTAEMRDAFYENFKELIEQCKELL